MRGGIDALMVRIKKKLARKDDSQQDKGFFYFRKRLNMRSGKELFESVANIGDTPCPSFFLFIPADKCLNGIAGIYRVPTHHRV